MNASRIAALGLGAAIALTASFEGLRNVGYADPVGIPTVCYGHTATAKIGVFVPTAQCKALLEDEFYAAALDVHRCSPVPLAPNELGALASAVFNIGPRLVCDTTYSTLARKLQAGDVRGACEQLTRWTKAKGVTWPGLVRRRAAERDMCLGTAP